MSGLIQWSSCAKRKPGKKSAGKKIMFNGLEHTVVEATDDVFDGVNIVLASAGGSTSLKLAPEAKKSGCVYIDNSSAFRMEKMFHL